MMKNRVCCALCNEEAATYCSSDSAFLCLICDAKVHEANFLVARHVRQLVCSNCKGFTGDRISGMCFQAAGQICQSCSPASANNGDLDSLSSSSSSACVSTTQLSASRKKTGSQRWRRGKFDSPTSATAKKGQTRPWRVDSKAEGVLVNWCTRLGLMNGDVADVARISSDALSICLDQLTILPFRVSLAASLWLGFRFCGIRSLSTWQGIKGLEEVSGVPAKLIAAAESKLERLFKAANKQRRQRQSHDHQLLEEGWAES